MPWDVFFFVEERTGVIVALSTIFFRVKNRYFDNQRQSDMCQEWHISLAKLTARKI